MPKRLKKPTPKKPRRPSDPNRAAHSMLAEHMTRTSDNGTPPHGDPFKEQLKAYMSRLGRKGGKASGAKRMEMDPQARSEIALKAATARWEKERRKKR